MIRESNNKLIFDNFRKSVKEENNKLLKKELNVINKTKGNDSQPEKEVIGKEFFLFSKIRFFKDKKSKANKNKRNNTISIELEKNKKLRFLTIDSNLSNKLSRNEKIDDYFFKKYEEMYNKKTKELTEFRKLKNIIKDNDNEILRKKFLSLDIKNTKKIILHNSMEYLLQKFPSLAKRVKQKRFINNNINSINIFNHKMNNLFDINIKGIEKRKSQNKTSLLIQKANKWLTFFGLNQKLNVQTIDIEKERGDKYNSQKHMNGRIQLDISPFNKNKKYTKDYYKNRKNNEYLFSEETQLGNYLSHKRLIFRNLKKEVNNLNSNISNKAIKNFNYINKGKIFDFNSNKFLTLTSDNYSSKYRNNSQKNRKFIIK